MKQICNLPKGQNCIMQDTERIFYCGDTKRQCEYKETEKYFKMTGKRIHEQLGVALNQDLILQLQKANQHREELMKQLPKAPKGWCWGFYADGRLDLISVMEEEG